MNKNSPLNQCYICSIGADGVHIILRHNWWRKWQWLKKDSRQYATDWTLCAASPDSASHCWHLELQKREGLYFKCTDSRCSL